MHKAYVAVISRGLIGQYYDVQGMDWTSAPMFASPDQTIQIGDRSYQLYYEGSNLKMVAWRQYGAMYWVRNTLTDNLSNAAMLAMAEQTYPLGGRVLPPAPRRTVLGAVGVFAKAAARAPVDAVQTYGPLIGLIAWLGIAFLAVRLFAGRRELAMLRAQVAQATAVETRSRAIVARRRVSPARPDGALASAAGPTRGPAPAAADVGGPSPAAGQNGGPQPEPAVADGAPAPAPAVADGEPVGDRVDVGV